MGFDKIKIKQIASLMCLAAVLVLTVIYSMEIFRALAFGISILSPFLVGGCIAFILKLPMNLIEEKLLGRWQGKAAGKLKRPISMVLSLIAVVLILVLVFLTVIPQLSRTIIVLGNKIPDFLDDAIVWLNDLGKQYPRMEDAAAELAKLEVDWKSLGDTIFGFLKNGLGSVVTSTVTVASGIIGGVANGVISLIFALYLLSQKEKLGVQCRKLVRAYLPASKAERVEYVFSLLNRNFSKFISGQCLEAVILGVMFIVVMLLFRMPYAVMIGVLIAFTALIPVVGAFIGCAVGAFLILIENPVQAFIFLILFLVLQQLEGNLIYPRVVGNSVGLPSIWVLLVVSVGGSLFGVVGMLSFIPLASTFYTLLREDVYKRSGTIQVLQISKQEEIREEARIDATKRRPVRKTGSQAKIVVDKRKPKKK